MNTSRLSNIMDKNIERVFLFYLLNNEEWMKCLTMLSKINSVAFGTSKPIKEKKMKCLKCPRIFSNMLLFMIHIQLIHAEEIQITKFQFMQDQLTIYSRQNEISQHKKFLTQEDYYKFQLQNSLNERIKTIINRIFAKFTKKHEPKAQKQFYHSTDIFRLYSQNSEDEDSQNQIGYIEKQLEEMRINQFTDVNAADKTFFMHWNDSVYAAKKEYTIIDSQAMKNILRSFAKKVKEIKDPNLQIPRISLVMHAWTLWSTGKITSIDVTNFLYDYDSA